jgi:hypothetical protein
MPRRDERDARPALEHLEERLQPSASLPANAIGSNLGTVTRPGATSAVSVMVAPKNLTLGKPSTIFGIFVQPAPGSALAPVIVGAEQGNGQRLSVKQGRPFIAGRDGGMAAAFVKVNQPGPLTVFVTGQHHTTGSFLDETTLAGDVNGDGTVNLADLAAFAKAYGSSLGDPSYNVAADVNQNGVVNLYDAKALEHNMTPLTPSIPLTVQVNLLPSQQAHYPTSKNSGGATFDKDITIVGHTTAGSLVITDSKAEDYSFTGAAVATDASGFFSIESKNSSGINNNDLLILDPFGRQYIRSFPVFWIPFAAPGSKLK